MLLRVSRASTHEQETLGAIGSSKKSVAVFSPTTNLGGRHVTEGGELLLERVHRSAEVGGGVWGGVGW